MSSFNKVKQLGDFLVENNIITLETLDAALKKQEETKGKLKKILIEEFNVNEDDLMQYGLAKQFNISYIDFRKEIEIEDDVLRIVDVAVAERFKVFPLKKKGKVLEVAMENPRNVVALDELQIRTKFKIEPFIASGSGIASMIEKHYHKGKSKEMMNEVMQALDDRYGDDVESVDLDEGADEDSAPVIKLANNIIEEAYKKGASDIHVEPFEEELLIRYRTDGVCKEVLNIPKHAQNALISRLKIMSELNIAERRLPQDGRIQFKKFTKGRIDIDLRVNSIPLVFGEKICMRILDKTATAVGLDKIGFNDYNYKVYTSIIKKPYGMLLHVGPTGSGKTTTLYSALNAINTPEINIQTAEDPVEYMLKGINQMPMKQNIGLTFATALRAFLRQDPDIIMVGEIRDLETAEIAVEAALTGHLVISTLHTNDAAGTVSRLIDMEIEPFLLSSALLGVCAQRLLRKVCKECVEEYMLSKEELAEMGVKVEESELKLFKGKGCPVCNGTGYKGRLGIHELLTLNDDIKQLMLKRASSAEIKEASIKNGMITIFEDGLQKAKDGFTTIDEVVRVTRED